jgi:phage-related protein
MTNLKTTFETGLQELKTLRDEIRVRLHLATQEARGHYEAQIEPHVERIEQQIKEVRDDTMETVKDAIDRAKTAFQEFRGKLGGGDQDRQALDETHRAPVKNLS